MVKSIAVIFGLVFIVIGILGFVPAIAPDGMLLNIFHVNAAHNVVHLATGIVALLCAMSGAGAARTFSRYLELFMRSSPCSAFTMAMSRCSASFLVAGPTHGCTS